MKRFFTYKDEKSDRFWAIETKEDELFTFYGKNNNKDDDPLCSKGQNAEKLFDTDEECEREANKLVAKKLKEGYIEQEEFFISLYNEIKYMCSPDYFREHAREAASEASHSWKWESTLGEVLKELDKRERPFLVSYGTGDWVESLATSFDFRVMYNHELEHKLIADLAYHLPKLEAADDEGKKNLLSLYGFALQSAAISSDEKLYAFCREQVPLETDLHYLAKGLVFSAAKWNRGEDEVNKYLRTSIKYWGDSRDFENEDFFKPYMKKVEAIAKEIRGY
jgi:predicted DNA-binding WGR domain protein